jgi:uncharacterized C2H2 Zn-finger protein
MSKRQYKSGADKRRKRKLIADRQDEFLAKVPKMSHFFDSQKSFGKHMLSFILNYFHDGHSVTFMQCSITETLTFV